MARKIRDSKGTRIYSGDVVERYDDDGQLLARGIVTCEPGSSVVRVRWFGQNHDAQVLSAELIVNNCGEPGKAGPQ